MAGWPLLDCKFCVINTCSQKWLHYGHRIGERPELREQDSLRVRFRYIHPLDESSWSFMFELPQPDGEAQYGHVATVLDVG